MKCVSSGLVIAATWVLVLASATWARKLPRAYLDVTTVDGVDPSGRADSSAGLDHALKSAISAGQVAFFPPGTYKVSHTLFAEQPHRSSTNTCGDKEKSVVMIGSTRGANRPLIRLADNAAGFGDPAKPLPVVHIRLPHDNDPNRARRSDEQERPPCAFGQVFRGIDISVGAGNAGAIGIHFSAAQQSTFEDSRIDATGGYAGVGAIPGRGTPTSSIEVIGGRYGFDFTPPGLRADSLGGSLVGVVLRDQERAAFHGPVSRGITVTGFTIKMHKGPVIDHKGGNVWSSNLVLTDGRIEIGEPSLAIKTASSAYLYLRQVYIRGACDLVQGGSNAAIPSAGSGWSLVEEYEHCPTEARQGKGSSVVSTNIIDGKRDQKQLVSVKRATGEPPDVLAMHVARIASFEDDGVVNAVALGAKGDGKADDTTAIQRAIDQHERVFLPPGTYVTTRPLELKVSTQLFGAPGLRTRLQAGKWSGETPAWMIVSPDDASARTVLADISINYPVSGGVGALHWRSGRHSVVKGVSRAYGTAVSLSDERQVYRVDGNGGGRWYRWESISGGKDAAHRGSRFLLVDGTSEPMTFYGFNPEHGSVPMVELREATNVRIFGTKVESKSDKPSLVIDRSRNVRVALFAANPKMGTPVELVRVNGGTGIEIAGLLRPGDGQETLLKAMSDGGSEIDVASQYFVALFRQGRFDHGAWPSSAARESQVASPDGGAVDVDNDGARDGAVTREDGADEAASYQDGGAEQGGHGTSGCTYLRGSPAIWTLWILALIGWCRRRTSSYR